MRIIGICGYKGSGKSEVAKYLIHKYGFVRYPFAQTLKNMLRTFGLTEAQVDGNMKEEPSMLLNGKTPRWAMQSLGTEWGRACIDANVWVRAWTHNLDRARNIIVDDLRFPNEAEALFKLGATLWRIERAGTEPPEGQELHPSERYAGLLPVHMTLSVVTDGLPRLHALVDDVVHYIPERDETVKLLAKLKEIEP